MVESVNRSIGALKHDKQGEPAATSVDHPKSLAELMDEAASQVGAHRLALQKRSKAKFERVIQATIELLEEGGPDLVTTTMVAARAGISVGWLYNFFEGREALLEEILVTGLRDLDRRLSNVQFDLGGPNWKEKAEAGVEAHIEYFADLPAVRALWFSSEFSGRMIVANRMHDNELAAFLARSITDVRPDAPDVPLGIVTQVFVGMLDKGVDLAYRENPRIGNDALLQEMKRSSIAYLATFLP